MDRLLLDTDIVSEIIKGRNSHVLARATAYRAARGALTFCTLTVLEVVKGLSKLGREDRIREFMSFAEREEVLTLDSRSAELAGRIFAGLESAGQPIGRIDPMIAAIALRNDLALVTGNTEHYERVKLLGYPFELDNWRE